jgi:hypothetical protein
MKKAIEDEEYVKWILCLANIIGVGGAKYNIFSITAGILFRLDCQEFCQGPVPSHGYLSMGLHVF